jgi:Spy/CpxP family protein refolding chaperone
MTKKTLLFTALALSMSLSQASLACHGDSHWMYGERYEKMEKKLHLTSDQKDKIKELRLAAHKAMQPLRQDLRDNHMKLNELARANTLDEGAIDSLINQQKEILGKLMKMRLMIKHDITMDLTEKQRSDMVSMAAKWKEHHKDEMEKMHDED